eukprot:m.271932 g.271932  ORF g.271932 m.271932 type:complete len:58 (+) comp40555_c0_seq47:3977-4150(+)
MRAGVIAQPLLLVVMVPQQILIIYEVLTTHLQKCQAASSPTEELTMPQVPHQPELSK